MKRIIQNPPWNTGKIETKLINFYVILSSSMRVILKFNLASDDKWMKWNVVVKWNLNLNLEMKGGKIKYHREIIITCIPVAILVPNFPLLEASFIEKRNRTKRGKKKDIILLRLDSYSWLTDGFSSFLLFMSLRNIIHFFPFSFFLRTVEWGGGLSM